MELVANGDFSPTLHAVFPVWRGLGAGLGGTWSQGWGRCLLRWEPPARSDADPTPAPDYPVWLLICRRGRARLGEVCLRGVGAVDSPAAVFGVKLPPLFDVHQVPKVSREICPASHENILKLSKP